MKFQWDVITYPCPISDGDLVNLTAFEVAGEMRDYIPLFYIDV